MVQVLALGVKSCATIGTIHLSMRGFGMKPKRLKYLVNFLTQNFFESDDNLPAPLILKGDFGVGKSWVLHDIYEALTKSTQSAVIPLLIRFHLTARGLVDELSFEIQSHLKNHDLNKLKGGAEKKPPRFVILIDRVDQLYNIFSYDGAGKAPKRAFGAGSAILKKIQLSSELRSFLIENATHVTIIGTSKYIDFMTDESFPFYNFFNIIEIKPLDHDESVEYVKEKLHTTQQALKLFSILNDFSGDHGIDLCDGKISYLNLFIGSILEATQLKLKNNSERVKHLYSLFFSKITPYIDHHIEQLSDGEKVLLDAVINLSDTFSSKEVPTLDVNTSKLLKSLVNKEILFEEGRSKNKRYQLASVAMKLWIKYKKDPLSIF